LTISSSRPLSAGSYNWTVPASVKTGSDYSVKITSTSNTAYYDFSDAAFTILPPPDPEITLTSPDGGENWNAGSPYNIPWNYVGSPGKSGRIELYKGGVRSKILVSSRSVGKNGSGSYAWRIPSTMNSGTDYSIKITSTSKSVYSDESQAPFTINGVPPPEITLTTPNQSETWQAGSTYVIGWSYVGKPGSYVKIQLLKGGILSSTISASKPIGRNGAGSYNWTIPSSMIRGSDYQIKVTTPSNAAYIDTSDEYFTIVGQPAPDITLTAPNEGESWQGGTTAVISWDYDVKPGNYVKIELYKNGVRSRVIVSSCSIGKNGSGSYSWRIPSTQTAGSDYTVKVTSTSNTACYDVSDQYFNIFK